MATTNTHSDLDVNETVRGPKAGAEPYGARGNAAADAPDPALMSFAGSRTLITLELTDQDAIKLEGALARRVRDTMQELVHTEDRTAHAELRATYEDLERLHRRVAGLIVAAVPRPNRREAKLPAT